ncbi:DNA-binding protein [Salmonella enterica subsp. enterica serovar Worthington]|uniref:integrase domain-containing protein n=1 Tax=Salmonella enterica TaxID=28901 RepID=UPI000F93F37F|nr:integrase domain-containing protein [Salmonella enterica]EBS1324570.1 DNA-binding protein [Salmonella enterica subsp. enterica serovar Muenchen]EBV7251983.1 DNA-binding protein [Salmonella enterica subsp. enterica serovar Pomona]EDJ9085167.1 DNA-binding protein [Salmonella enterica subsp. enterica serovar Vitkin]EGI5052554.1 DNA-binding protein [Salmonella enterica subsp. enterica serovar Worthington]EEJ1801971.1 DNA-binding protein [Salmonella enterica subsp. enterica serovar Pomona]
MKNKSARSKVEQFRRDFVTLARDAGRSYATVADSMRIARYFLNYLRDNGIKLRHTDSIKTRHFAGYLLFRKSQGISVRTIQNERSAIRGVLNQAGRYKLADPDNPLLSNKALGLEESSRDGTKLPLNPEEFHKAFSVVEKNNRGVAAAMLLSYTLGLRNKEAVEACKSIKTWKRAIDSGQNSVRIVFGTKGGRPRNTVIVDRDAVSRAVSYAEKVMKENNGKLVDRPDIRKAVDTYRYYLRRAGLTGEKAPHSMRYHYSQEARRFYESKGYTEREIYAQVSMDLGHGDGRGRYVKQVYFRNGADEE